MGTFELLIVFAALMAVISLVAIAIDWVGRPLRNRRFIPRIYRYGDELVADPALFDAPYVAVPPVAASPVAAAPAMPHPAPVAPVVVGAGAPVDTTVAVPVPPDDDVRPPTRRIERRSQPGSSFRDAVGSPEPSDGADASHHRIARTVPEAAAAAWHAGMALDARVGDRKATVAVKAERYWKAAAAHLADDHGHFDHRSRELMAQGKPPRRRNPRTGDVEAMELVGLRAASDRSDVRMRWPDDAVDPWSPS